jgi:pyruvate,water dikinase
VLKPSPSCTGNKPSLWEFNFLQLRSALTQFYGSFENEWHLEQVGGKAFYLSLLSRQGRPVPPGMVVSDAFFQSFLESNHLPSKIQEFLKSPDLAQAAEEISLLFAQATVPPELWSGVLQTLREKMPAGPLMVRSSAVGEDSAGASFAGQLDSFQCDGTEEDLLQCLLKCWASLYSERSLSYQKSRGIMLSRMGVVIQALIDPCFAGVLFTENPHPVEGFGPDDFFLEYCTGHGDKLVSGRINPGSYLVRREDLQCHHLLFPEQEGLESEDGTLLIPPDSLQKLAQEALLLMSSHGTALDIEWVMDREGAVFLVQMRPITRSLLGPKLSTEGAETVKASPGGSSKRSLWSNVNVNENYPDPISPLLYSIAYESYYHYFRNLGVAIGVPERELIAHENELRTIIGAHGARMYYNLSHIHSLLRVLPFGDRLSEQFNVFIGVFDEDPAVEKTPPKKPGNWWDQVLHILRLGRIVLHSARTFASFSRQVTSIEKEVDAHVAQSRQEANSLAGRSSSFQRFLVIRFQSWKKASLADLAAMITYGSLRSLVQVLFKNTGHTALHNSLLKGSSGVVSSVPPQKIWELAEMVRQTPALKELFESQEATSILASLTSSPLRMEWCEFHKKFSEFLDAWGSRCSGELMLTVPNFRESPVLLIPVIQGYLLANTPAPQTVIAAQNLERQQLLAKLKTELRANSNVFTAALKWRLFKVLLQATHHAIACRERVRMKQALLYGELRATVLAIGESLVEQGLLASRDDIFLLHYEEIAQYLAGAMMLPKTLNDLVVLRRREFETLSQLNPPDHFWLAAFETVNAQKPLSQRLAKSTGRELKGLSACGGQVKACVRVLTSVKEAPRLQSGDILVTKQTDPGWGPIFPMISGLIMERGGMLSHGAIIAREFGIPAIVGVRNATDILMDGGKVQLNGDAGVVQY